MARGDSSDGRAQLRADMLVGAVLLGVGFGMVALLGGCVVSAFGVSIEAGLGVVGLSAVPVVAGAVSWPERWLGAGLGLLLATSIAVVLAIGAGGAVLLPLVVVPACTAAFGAAVGALRMYVLAVEP